MTAQHNCCGNVYIYAQSLDNSGVNPCLVSKAPGEYREIETGDPERATLLRIIDNLSNDGRHWKFGTTSLDCIINNQGDCLVTAKPLTRDQSGRLAPIMLIFNIWHAHRQLSPAALEDGSKLMKRELSASQLQDIIRLKQVMNWPSLLIAIHSLIFSRRVSHD